MFPDSGIAKELSHPTEKKACKVPFISTWLSPCGFYCDLRWSEGMPLSNTHLKDQQGKWELAHKDAKLFKSSTVLPTGLTGAFTNQMFVCGGKVNDHFIILKRCAVWTTKWDPTLQWCADQALGQEKPLYNVCKQLSTLVMAVSSREGSFCGTTQETAKREATECQKSLCCAVCEISGGGKKSLPPEKKKKWLIAHISGRV